MDQAESLRTLVKKTSEPNSGAKVISVTSGKGGAGKSSTVLNLALNLGKIGKKVIIIDADFGLSNIEVMLGMYPKYNMSDFLYKGRDLEETITWINKNTGFISGGSGIAGMINVTSRQREMVIEKINELSCICDMILIDTGAGISPGVQDFLVSSSEIIIVTSPEPAAITDAYALVKSLSLNKEFDSDLIKINVICNRTNNDDEGMKIFDKLNSVTNRFLDIKLKYLGIVPYDGQIAKAAMKQKPVSTEYPNSLSAKAYENIAGYMAAENDYKKIGKRGANVFFSNIFVNKRGY